MDTPTELALSLILLSQSCTVGMNAKRQRNRIRLGILHRDNLFAIDEETRVTKA